MPHWRYDARMELCRQLMKAGSYPVPRRVILLAPERHYYFLTFQTGWVPHPAPPGHAKFEEDYIALQWVSFQTEDGTAYFQRVGFHPRTNTLIVTPVAVESPGPPPQRRRRVRRGSP